MQTAVWPGPSQEMPPPAGRATQRICMSQSLTLDGGVGPVRTGNHFGLHFPVLQGLLPQPVCDGIRSIYAPSPFKKQGCAAQSRPRD